MAAIPESNFAVTLQQTDRENLVSLIVAVWEANGWATSVSGPLVTAKKGNQSERILVDPEHQWHRRGNGGPTQQAVEYVVTRERNIDQTDSFVPAGCTVLTPDDIRDRLLTTLEPARADKVTEETLGIPLRSDRWETSGSGDGSGRLGPGILGGRATPTVLVVVGVVGLVVVGAAVGGVLLTLSDSPERDAETDSDRPVPPKGDDKPDVDEIDKEKSPDSDSPDTGQTQPQATTGPMLYVGALDNSLYALDPEDGSQQWNYAEPTDGIASSPTVVDGTIYVGTGDGTVDAIDAATGELDWRFTRPSTAIFSSPTVADIGGTSEDAWGETQAIGRTVFVPSHDGTVYAINASTGTQEWAFTETAGQVVGSPMIGNETLFIGDNEQVYALDARNGTLQWRFSPVTPGVVSSPAVLPPHRSSTDLVYTSVGGTLYALHPDTGEKRWAVTNLTTELTAIAPTVAPPISTPAGANEPQNGTVYVIGSQNTVRAIDAATGRDRWQFSSNATFTSSPTVAGGVVYAGTENGSLYALDERSGERVWVFDNATESIHTVPTVAAETVYFGTDNGTVYGLDSATGTPEFRETISERWIRSSPTVVADTRTGHSIDSRVLLGTHGTYVGVHEFGPLAQLYLGG